MLAQLARLAKKLSDAFDDRLDLVPANERVQTGCEMRFGRESAGHAQRETSFRLSIDSSGDRSQSNIIDLWIGAPNPAARDRNLELSRQVVKVGIARKHSGRSKGERRRITDFIGIHARHRAAGDVPRDIAASSHAVQAALPQRLKNLGKRFNGHPVKLDILAHGQVSNAASMTLGQPSNGSQLRRIQNAVGDADAKHEARQRLAFAAFSADHPCAVSLGVNPPPAEVGAQPFGRNRIKTSSREASDLVDRIPRVLLPFQSLDSLCLRFFCSFSLCHKKKNPPPASYWRWVRLLLELKTF